LEQGRREKKWRIGGRAIKSLGFGQKTGEKTKRNPPKSENTF
jgi:hypothetical protein